MRLSGRNIRRIYSDERLAFELDMELTEVTGEASFGISGLAGATPKSTLFNFKSGRVFDPNGNNVIWAWMTTILNKGIHLTMGLQSKPRSIQIQSNSFSSFFKVAKADDKGLGM